MDGNTHKKPRRLKDGECEKNVFSEEDHREFVSAIFDIGVQESSPLAIMEHMNKNRKKEYEGLNLEKVKSKLQKYRKNKSKYKTEFMDAYDTACSDFGRKNGPNKRGGTSYRQLPSAASLSSGEVAAFLSYSVMLDKKQDSNTSAQHDVSFDNMGNGGGLALPIVTEDETQTPVGRAIGVFTTLFLTLKEELYKNRLEKKETILNRKLCDRSEDKPRCFRSRHDPINNNSSQPSQSSKSGDLGNAKNYSFISIQQNPVHDNENGSSDHHQGFTIPHVDSYSTIQPLRFTHNSVDVHSAELLSHLSSIFPSNSTIVPTFEINQEQCSTPNQHPIQQGARPRTTSHGFHVPE